MFTVTSKLVFPSSVDIVFINPKQKVHWAKIALGTFCRLLVVFRIGGGRLGLVVVIFFLQS